MGSWRSRARAGLLAGIVAFGLAACGPSYERTEITGIRLSKLGGGIDNHRLEVHEGMIVKAHIVAWNDDQEPMPLLIRAVDPSVIEVARVIHADDYAFIGLRLGQTKIELVADGEVVHRIDAEVVAQPEMP